MTTTDSALAHVREARRLLLDRAPEEQILEHLGDALKRLEVASPRKSLEEVRAVRAAVGACLDLWLRTKKMRTARRRRRSPRPSAYPRTASVCTATAGA